MSYDLYEPMILMSRLLASSLAQSLIETHRDMSGDVWGLNHAGRNRQQSRQRDLVFARDHDVFVCRYLASEIGRR